MTSTHPYSPVLTTLLALLLLHTSPALGLPMAARRRDFYGAAGNRNGLATAGIALSSIALVLSIVAFGLMLYNRRMRAQDERCAARAHELAAVEAGDAKRG